LLAKKDDFFEEYNINNDEFNKTNLTWDMLNSIYEDYLNIKDQMEIIEQNVFNILGSFRKVQSIRTRVKALEHLIEKIISLKKKS
jgi:ppGpp synthetase/RelA/SpoT-type nucleotidyltranferase